MKRILKFGLVAVIASALTTAQAQVPQPAPKPDKPRKERPEKGGKKWNSEKMKERLKAAFEKRKKNRGDAKKRGHKVHDRKKGGKRGSAFGKLVRDDAKIKELREAFAAASKKLWEGFDKDKWKDATDDQKKALREKLAAGKKDWMDRVKAHQKEVRKRLEEIKKEFKNKRDKVIDGNKPGE